MNFIRSFFTSAVKLSPEAKMANVKEVQRIIDQNNVGMFCSSTTHALTDPRNAIIKPYNLY
jgi:hypothetical protein